MNKLPNIAMKLNYVYLNNKLVENCSMNFMKVILPILIRAFVLKIDKNIEINKIKSLNHLIILIFLSL